MSAGRVLGIDLGAKRIGVAVSDAGGVLASPLAVVERLGDRTLEHRRLRELVEEYEVTAVVVGLPLSLDGSEGPAARAARVEAEAVAAAVGLPLHLVDERFTTTTATDRLAEAGVGSRKRRGVVDMAAAAVLLQHWLDGRRAGMEVDDAVR